MGATLEIGFWAEEEAAKWLIANGFRVLHRNWRAGRYELDIVAAHSGVLHFVEVKCRRRGGLTAPEYAATGAKMRSLMRAANAYIAHYQQDAESQFDLIAVEYNGFQDGVGIGIEIRYIPRAMTPRW